jgi:predicted ester cyclase
MADPREVTERGLRAWRARDADAFANCYSDDATLAGPGGMALQGHDGARQFIGMWAEGVPDNEITIEHEWVAGSVVVQEGIFSGTHTGTLMTPDGQAIPATGRSIKAAYADVFEIEGDRITAERLYFDQVELLTQLGLMPEPAATASA